MKFREQQESIYNHQFWGGNQSTSLPDITGQQKFLLSVPVSKFGSLSPTSWLHVLLFALSWPSLLHLGYSPLPAWSDVRKWVELHPQPQQGQLWETTQTQDQGQRPSFPEQVPRRAARSHSKKGKAHHKIDTLNKEQYFIQGKLQANAETNCNCTP